MITQVGGRIRTDVSKDPRRRAQSVQFRNRICIPYQGKGDDSYTPQEQKALRTSLLVVAGSMLFMVAYFTITALGTKKVAV